MAMKTVLVPPPPAALDVLCALEKIDADGRGEPTRRKLEILHHYGQSVQEWVLAEVTLGIHQSGVATQ